MKLTFLGADREVTGSCHFLEACGKKILIDCGMQQGADEYNNQDMPVSPPDIDFVFLTHAHIDHSGRLPLLSKMGFKGKIFATYATEQLCGIMLRDSAHIQEFEAEWHNRKSRRAGEEIYEPLYTMQDAEKALACFISYSYNQIIQVCEDISIRFIDVGHLLGSSSIEVWAEEESVNKKIVFSGDIGNINQPLIKDPKYITEADYVVMECTYGDRNHHVPSDYPSALAKVITETFDKGGNVVIPSFAVGRTQELLYFLRDIVKNNLVPGYPNIPVYVDSPLAIEATNVFNKNVEGYYDDEAMTLISQGINPISFPGLKLSVTSDESKAINVDDSSKVIISASGMCDAGRIRHHLKHNLWRKESTIVFVGFQAVGTLGRSLLDGARNIKLFGESIIVKAEIVNLEGMSGHADQTGLIRWINSFEKKPEQVFIVHGESAVCDSFAALIQNKYSFQTLVPNYETSFDLIRNELIDKGTVQSKKPVKIQDDKQQSRVFKRLLSSGERLIAVINRNKDNSNKDLAKFADQINALCEKWDL
jgi:metallo-beta-lactamase family protein